MAQPKSAPQPVVPVADQLIAALLAEYPIHKNWHIERALETMGIDPKVVWDEGVRWIKGVKP